MEAAALSQLRSTLGDCMAAPEIEALWREYEAGESAEAQLVKDFDKVSRERSWGGKHTWVTYSRVPWCNINRE
jgi:5'-deoxynucleotidase YfbR-like HD superfamily hydrolase